MPKAGVDAKDRTSKHLYFNLSTLAALALAYLAASTVLDLMLPRFIETTHYAGDYWPFGFGSIVLGCAGYAALYGARDCFKAGVANVGRILTAVGIFLEGIPLVGGIMVLIEAYRCSAWVNQFSAMGQIGTDIRYWVAAVSLLCCIAGNSVGAIILFSEKY